VVVPTEEPFIKILAPGTPVLSEEVTLPFTVVFAVWANVARENISIKSRTEEAIFNTLFDEPELRTDRSLIFLVDFRIITLKV
jgi:hypothetical protein